MKKFFITMVVLIVLITPIVALAQTTPCTLEAVQGSENKLGELPRCINQIYIWSLGIGGLLAFLMMVAGGYYYMTSSGNAEQATKGTEMIWGAIIGLALLFGAYLLLNTINPDLVDFSNFTNNAEKLDPNQQPTNPANPRQTP